MISGRIIGDDVRFGDDLDEAEFDEAEVPEERRHLELTFMELTEAGDVVSFVEVDHMGRWYDRNHASIQQLSCFGTQAEYVFNEENEG